MKVIVVATFISLLSLSHALINAKAQSDDPLQEKREQDKQQQNKIDQDDLGIIGPVRIHIIHETGTLIVSGENADDVRKVKALIEKIIESAQRGRPDSRLIKLKNAHAKYVAPWAQHLYDLNFAARQGAVTITAHNQSELFIVGPPAAIDEAKKIVTMLDR